MNTIYIKKFVYNVNRFELAELNLFCAISTMLK